jgi:hypothetical protein
LPERGNQFFWGKAHYRAVARQLSLLDADLGTLTGIEGAGGEPDPRKPTAVLLVGKFGGLGVHSMLSIQRTFPDYFANLIGHVRAARTRRRRRTSRTADG